MKDPTRVLAATAALVFLGVVACGGSHSARDDRPSTAPAVTNARVAANPNNVISAQVNADVTGANRVQVTYTSDGGEVGSTPEFATSLTDASAPVRVPVLGLRPETNYTLQLEATAANGLVTRSNALSFRTGTLPSMLPTFRVTDRSGGESQFTMVSWVTAFRSGWSSSGSFPAGPPDTPPIALPLIVDQTGRVVWYREPVEGTLVDWQKQLDGTYTAAITDLYLQELGYYDTTYFQFDSLGNIIRRYFAVGIWPTDSHELRVLPNGDALLMSLNVRTMDLTAWGGGPAVDVVGNILERISPSGQLLFAWNALDRVAIGSTDPVILRDLDPETNVFDFTHANAIDVASDGSYLISLRHLSQILKVTETGSIAWKFGGVDSHFAFVGDPLNGFSLQHGVRELPNGNVLLFDNGNGHQPPQSRAVEYRLDVAARTATLVWQYNPDPHVFGPFMGFTQRLQNGNTLITYGARQLIQEVTPAGEVVWQLDGESGGVGFYRGIRISSLY